MRTTRILMGMPITIEIADKNALLSDINEIYEYFKLIDQKFSTYKKNSEISRINGGRLKINDASRDVKLIFKLANKTKKETQGYFDIYHEKKIDPSGIVKGWAIFNAANQLLKKGYKNLYIDAGGDIQSYGKNNKGIDWSIGIRNPFNQSEIIKVISPKNKGVATSGTYIRGNHIYNPKNNSRVIDDIISLTVIGPNIYEADRFATAAFAMGRDGINFIENLSGFEGYLIDKKGIATYTSGFSKYETN